MYVFIYLFEKLFIPTVCRLKFSTYHHFFALHVYCSAQKMFKVLIITYQWWGPWGITLEQLQSTPYMTPLRELGINGFHDLYQVPLKISHRITVLRILFYSGLGSIMQSCFLPLLVLCICMYHTTYN